MSMHSKNKFLQSREEQSPNKRLKANISDLLLDGTIGGVRAASLFTDAQDAQAEGLEGLAGVSQNQNALRDLQRRLTKQLPWPPLYPAKVHMKSLATELVYVDTVYMLLPHELCHQLIHWNQNAGVLPYAVEGLTPPARERFLTFCRQFSKDASSTLPLGFWVDGVPVKWNRSESIILFTLNFPGQLHTDFKTIRIPLTMINKKFFVEETMKDLLGIISWSFTCLHARFFLASPMPGQEPFNSWRQKQAGKPLNAGGMLIEIRGDWDAYKNWFGLAGWNTANCCYRCQATSEDIRDPSLSAAWRSQRKTLWQHLSECKFVSPLFSIPGVTLETFVIDWLHCMDLGMAADFAGNLLFHVLPCFPGRDIKQQCKVLHRHLQSWYRDNPGWSNKLTSLTPLMIRKKNAKGRYTSPKLRASAGEMRPLVPWLLQLAQCTLDNNKPLENMMLAATQHLVSMYQCLSRAQYSPAEMGTHCRKFLLLYVELEKNTAEGLWKFKPKFHMAQELCEHDLVNPSVTWVYRNKDFGGSMAKVSKHRGGTHSALAISKNALLKFVAGNEVPTWPVDWMLSNLQRKRWLGLCCWV